MRIKLCILGILFSTSLSLQAQVVQVNRVELQLGNTDGLFEVIPAQHNGLLLQRWISTPDIDQIELMKLDTAFQQEWHGYLPLDKKLVLMGKRIVNDQLFLLLRHQDFARKDFELYTLQLNTGNFSRFSIRNFIAFAPTDFQVTQHSAIIGGYFNTIPVVMYYSFATQKSKILPGLFNEVGELTQVQAHDDGSFDVLISARNFQGQKTIWIKNYDPDGNLLRNLALNTEPHKHLIFARSIKTSDNMQLVAGVYGSRNSAYSKGIFISSIDPAGLQQTKYYNYADFQNFFKYMKAKREQRVKDRIERRKIRGKKIRFNYRFMVHEIVPYNNQYVLVGEAFYPQYTTMDRSYYNGFFTPSSYSNRFIRDGRVFDGYRYTHAVVMGFNPDGRVMWDNSFEINDVKTFTLEQFVKLERHPDKIALLYLFDNDLRSKIIQGNEVLEGKSVEPLRTTLDNDVAKTERSMLPKLEYWYNDYFYAFGVQEIENPQFGKRRVFFINKISYAD